LKLDALDHPKTLDLAARLDTSIPAAIGHLELLWAFTGKKAPMGNIGKWPDGAIARACYWMDEPVMFIAALVDAGFLDEDSDHRLLVHDWFDHAPRWVKSKLKSLGEDFILAQKSVDIKNKHRENSVGLDVCAGVSYGGGEDIGGDTSPDVSGDTKGREGKCSEGKGREGKIPNGSRWEPPIGINLTAWDEFEEHRRSIRKPMTDQARTKAANLLLTLTPEQQQECVDYSITGRYTGLFPDRLNGGKNGSTQNGPKPSVSSAAAAAEKRLLDREERERGRIIDH